MTDNNIYHLDARLRPLANAFVQTCASAGLNARITVTWRNAADQNAAKAKGLSKAVAGKSPHNCVDAMGNPASKAFDFALFDKNRKYITDGTDARYAQAGQIGKTIGLDWGGDWKAPYRPDYDHFQLKNWKTI